MKAQRSEGRATRRVRALMRAAARLLRRSAGAAAPTPPPRALFRSGRAAERAGHPADAIRAYRAAIDHAPDRPHWHFRLGRTLEHTRHWTEAAAAYRAAIALDPTRARWHFRLGRTLERTRHWAGAADAYSQAIARDDTHTAWYQRHAAALRRAHDREGLRRAVEVMMRREPDMSAAERRLLAADPRRFDVRRRILRFVTDHLDEIHDLAAEPLPASPHPRDRIWVYWGQGMRQAPAVVTRCHAELVRHHGSGPVVVLDDTTVGDHSDLPGHVHDRTRDDRTKFSDALRLDLLAHHGGIWLDATCLVRRDLHAVLPGLLASGLFALRYRRARIASWLLAAAPRDRSMATIRAAQIVYWRHHDAPIDYFVLHHLVETLFEVDPTVRASVTGMPRVSAHTPSRFARAMFEPYRPDRYRALLDATFVHKLSHKIPPGRDISGTMLGNVLVGEPSA